MPYGESTSSKSAFSRRPMTRLDVFTDAAFAFAAAMLAISIDEIPASYAELIDSMKGAPAFAASMAILLLFWRAHQSWSERYALEDLPAVLLTFALVMIIMVYVYPLKIIFQGGFGFLTNGWLPSDFSLNSLNEFRGLITIYSIGFFALCGVVSALYGYAWRQREVMHLTPEQSFEAAAEAISWLIVGAFGLLAIVLAWTLSGGWVAIAPWSYCLLAAVGPLMSWKIGKIQRARFAEKHAASVTTRDE